ncbi:coiled-coil domain-containing protein 138 isoform X3 [Lepisosteus oculatus]|uniref:coiled-coil domain-containing protein 138 isoform X3 n=1 Tax=Lepisosteus oculatus TaxID=7918 RepID=UPI0035F50287
MGSPENTSSSSGQSVRLSPSFDGTPSSGCSVTGPWTDLVTDRLSPVGEGGVSVWSEERRHPPAELKQVCQELEAIHSQLQVRNKAQRDLSVQLWEREQHLLRSEAMVLQHQRMVLRIGEMEKEMQNSIHAIREHHQREVAQLKESLKQKLKENKRLVSSFESMRELNDSLKKQINDVTDQNKRLGAQTKRVQARLDNLQRKCEYLMEHKIRKNVPPAINTLNQPKQDKPTATVKPAKASPRSSAHHLTAVLLDWISESHLCNLPPREDGGCSALGQHAAQNNFVQEKCVKVLPMLSEQLRLMPLWDDRLQVPLVKCIYWSLRQIEKTPQITLTSTLRRLGEEIYKGALPNELQASSPDQTSSGKLKSAVLFKSPDLHTRFLSTLIVLKTISQADYLAHAFDSLQKDLQSDEGRALFLQYQALPLILGHLRTAPLGLLPAAMGVLLQMTTESRLFHTFLETCSNKDFFRTVSLLLRNPKLDVQLLEKLIIILQKLSKIKKNKRLFELFTIHHTVQEMNRTADPTHVFLIINLRSILFNLGLLEGGSSSSSLKTQSLTQHAALGFEIKLFFIP